MIVARLIYFCDVLPFKAEKLNKIRNAHALMETIERGIGNSKEPVRVIGWVPYDIWFYDKKRMLAQNSGSEATSKEYFIGYEDGIKSLGSYKVINRIFYKHKVLVFGMFSPVTE